MDTKRDRSRLILQVALAGLSLYFLLWLVTALKGTSQVQRTIMAGLGAPASSRDISAIVPFASGPMGAAPVPCHWCRSRAYAPFLVLSHFAVDGGGLNASGGRALHFWCFGYIYRVRDLGGWDS